MRKNIKILLYLLSILVIILFSFIIGCSYPSLTVYEYDGKQITVNFLDKDSAFEYIQNSNYTERMNRLNISLRLDEDLNCIDRKDEVKAHEKFIRENIKDWDGYEKHIVWGALEDAIEKLDAFSPAIIPDTLFFISTSMRLEFNAFFTVNKAICVPSSVVWPLLFDGLIEKKIAHELFHIYSRYNKPQRDSLYAIFNFFNSDTIIAGKILSAKMINNPDVHSNNYVLSLEDTSGELKDLFLIVRLNEPKYNNNRGAISFLGATNIFDFFDGHILELENIGDNSFRVKDSISLNGYELAKIHANFDEVCGSLSSDRFFAEEILAESFSFGYLVIEDNDLLEDCSKQDREKLQKILKIIRGY